MKAAVITFPASNCNQDAIFALKKINAKVVDIWYKESSLPNDLDLIFIPGGFSFGDYLRSGAMAAISPIMQEVTRLSKRGVKVLGVCNGFQILTEAGLLPGVLMKNRFNKFICKTINLKVESNNSAFTKNYQKNQLIKIPVAHMDGQYFASPETVNHLKEKDLIAFRYSSDSKETNDSSNINGSIENIAGIFNLERNILGMMPHPERAVDTLNGSIDGMPIFQSLMQ